MSLHPKWEAYLRLQNECSKRRRLDSKAESLEAGLDAMVELIALDAPLSDIISAGARAVSSRRRREDYRKSLMRKVVEVSSDDFRLSLDQDRDAQIQARDEFRHLMATLNSRDQIIINSLAHGNSSDEIAESLHVTPALVRARISRIRRTIRH